MSALVVLSTFPSLGKANEIARALVEEQLAACVNVIEGVVSTYRWEGKITTDTEALAFIKTTRERLDALTARLVELHPYDVPEVIALDVAAGHAPYLAWLASATRAR